MRHLAFRPIKLLHVSLRQKPPTSVFVCCVLYFWTFHRITGRSLISKFHDHSFLISASNWLFLALIRFWVSPNFSIFRIFWIWRGSKKKNIFWNKKHNPWCSDALIMFLLLLKSKAFWFIYVGVLNVLSFLLWCVCKPLLLKKNGVPVFFIFFYGVWLRYHGFWWNGSMIRTCLFSLLSWDNFCLDLVFRFLLVYMAVILLIFMDNGCLLLFLLFQWVSIFWWMGLSPFASFMLKWQCLSIFFGVNSVWFYFCTALWCWSM